MPEPAGTVAPTVGKVPEAQAALPAPSEVKPGGLSAASVTNAGVVTAAAAAISAQDNAMSAEKKVALTLVEIVSAQQQIVAGINYHLVLKVKVDSTEREAKAVVWKKLSGEYQLTSWAWK